MRSKSIRSTLVCKCEVCHVEFHPPQSSVGVGLRLLSGAGRFCSHKCSGIGRRGEKVPLWDRFWEKVNKDGPLPADESLGKCWVFGRSSDGDHQRVGISGIRSPVAAHRISYEWEYGPITKGLIVRHRCDRRCCVRPSHLCLGTTKDNGEDWSRRGPGVVSERSPRVTIPTPERLWSKVNRDGPIPAHMPELGPCWLWTGAKDTVGYGKLRMVIGGKKTTRPAHRVAYELEVGLVPEGLFVLHKCDTPGCVNVAHLTTGTQKENMQDKINKRRNTTKRKLSEEQVREIRRRAALGESQTSLAREFGITQSVVSEIANRKAWRHVV